MNWRRKVGDALRLIDRTSGFEDVKRRLNDMIGLPSPDPEKLDGLLKDLRARHQNLLVGAVIDKVQEALGLARVALLESAPAGSERA